MLDIADRAVDPDLSAKRSAAGKRGQEAKRALRLVTSEDEAGEANECSFASKTPKQNAGDFAVVGGPVAARFAPPSYGSIDRSFVENISKTDDRSNRAGADARESEPGAQANSQAKPPSKIADQKAEAEVSAAPSSPPLAPSKPDMEALITALRVGCGTRIPAVLLHATDLAPIRSLLAEGCDLERDVVPAVANFVAGCKGPLRSFGAGPIREKAIASRDRAIKVVALERRPLVFADPLLSKVAKEIEARIGEDATASWFRDMAVASTEASSLTLALPTAFMRKHVEQNYELQVLAAVRSVDARFAKVLFTVVAAPATGGGRSVGRTDGSLPPPGG